MKPLSVWLLFLSLSLGAQTTPLSPVGGAQREEAYRVTDRGPHHRVWTKVRWETNQIGRLVAETNSYVELATGLHFRDRDLVSDQWQESDPSFELTKDGYAVARNCQHQVIISPNLNPPDGIVVDLQMSDGQRLRSGIVGLNLFDPDTDQSLQIAAVRDSVGTLVSSNEVVWSDAFEGLKADVRIRNERGQFHQDVILREKLSVEQLRRLGFNPRTARVEIWTEFLDAPTPSIQRTLLKTKATADQRAALAEPDEADESVDFGPMQIGPGSGFIETEPDKSTRIFKQWYQNGQRRFLIESIGYEELAPLLQALPVKTAGLAPKQSTARLAATRIPPIRSQSSTRPSDQRVRLAQLELDTAKTSPGVVLDYPLSGAYPDYTLRGDMTYYISGYVGLSGTTTIEGGTVIKFAPYNSGVYLQFNGTVQCLTGPYRPAIFTARDDNTVGEVISGSTGTPSGYYASTALYSPGWTAGDLHHLHIRHAMHAITWYYGPARLSDLQLVNCYYGIGRTYTFAPVHNVLLHNVVLPFWGHAVNYDIEHATVNQCAQLASVYGTYSQGYLNLTNCVLANVTSWGSYNQLNADYNCHFATPPLSQIHDFPASASPFEAPVGAGNHYLAAGSSFRDVGNWLINSDLLRALKTKTTYPPQVQVDAITQDTTWSPTATQRDMSSGDLPDLGYHYEPMDYVVSGRTVSANLTLTGGVALGTYGAANSCGLALNSGTFVSEGTPTQLNWIVRYNTVQEQSTSAWSSSTVGASVKRLAYSPVVNVRFTGWSLPGGTGEHFYDNSGGNAPSVFSHSEFSGGKFTLYTSSTALTNCLLHRVYAKVDVKSTEPALYLFNNLMYGGTLSYGSETKLTMRAYNNLFDKTTILNRGIADGSCTHGNNGYAGGIAHLTGTSTGGDVDITSPADYQVGPRGKYYYPTTGGNLSQLIDAGTGTPSELGLEGFTTRTDQTPDSDMVDIGLHYPVISAPTTCTDDQTLCVNGTLQLCGSDSQNLPLTFITVQAPAHGTLGYNQSGNFVYTPVNCYSGADTFAYKVNNGFLDSPPDTVTVTMSTTVTANPDATQETCKNTATTFNVSGSDSCGLAVTTYELVGAPPPNAQFTLAPDGSVNFTPANGYCGSVSFQFRAINQCGQISSPATVTISVGDPNPQADCQDVMIGINTPVTFTLSGSDGCADTLDFDTPAATAQGGSLTTPTRVDATHVSVTYTPPSSTFEGADQFTFTVSNCGFESPQQTVTINVVSEPMLFIACRQDRINLRWAPPQWIIDQYGNWFFNEFRIYRCETTSGSCTPTVLYATVTDGYPRDYTDTGVEQGKTYCYRVSFRHRNSCNPPSTPEFYESPASIAKCSQVCTPPRVLVSGNTGAGNGSPIQTYDFLTGDLLNSFVPEHASNGRGLAIQGTEIFYTGRFDDSIHVCSYGSEGSGATTDTRTLVNAWRPGVEIQDLAFHGNVLYALTGYPGQQLEVFKLNPNTGAVIGGAIPIGNPASSTSDGFTVLPNGNFFINDFDGFYGCTIYREYSSTTGNLVSGGLVIDLRPFGFAQARGVATAPNGQSLYFAAAAISGIDGFDGVDTFVQTDLAGNLLGFQPAPSAIEDIDVVIP